MTETKKAPANAMSKKITNIRWEKYYENKRVELVKQMKTIVSRSRLAVDEKVLIAIAKGLIQRKTK